MLNLAIASILGVGLSMSETDTYKVGDIAPPLTFEELLQAPDGAIDDPSLLKDKVVVLEFWATWCGPCIVAIPELNELAEQFKDKPVQFVSITDEKRAHVEKFLEQRPINTWVALDTDRSMFHAYNITGIPLTILIDRKGKIAGMTSPVSVTNSVLEKLVAGEPIAVPSLNLLNTVDAKPSDDMRAPALFELSIRQSSATAGGSSWAKGKLKMTGQSLTTLVSRAWETPFSRMVFNGPTADNRYDVTIEAPLADESQVCALLRSALQSTFDIRTRNEPQQKEVYVLSAPDKSSIRLIPAVSEGRYRSTGNGQLKAVGMSIQELADSIEDILGKPAYNETEITGRYDFLFKWNPKDPSSFPGVLKKECGLDLQKQSRPVDMLIVEFNAQSAKIEKHDRPLE
jgi:uncharacterized protein (TIGR03435 family)